MTYTREFLKSQKAVNGWCLSGDKRKTSATARGLVANCSGCGYESLFGTLSKFLTNSRRCRNCEFYTEEESALRQHYAVYKTGAKRRGLAWSLSLEQFRRVVEQPCHYCCEPGAQRFGGLVWPWSGVDRVDNTLGYTEDNVRPSCRICNVAKNNLSEHEWRQKIMKWQEYLSRENSF